QNVIETVSISPEHHLAGAAVPTHIGENGDLNGVIIVGVVRRELKIPLQLSGIGIESQNAIGVEVIAGPLSGIPVGARIAGAPIRQIEIGIVRARNPDGRASVLPIIPVPGFVAGLAGTWNGV